MKQNPTLEPMLPRDECLEGVELEEVRRREIQTGQ